MICRWFQTTDQEQEARQGKTDNRAEISSIETENRIIQTNIDKLNDSLELPDGDCPTCLRLIDEECREHLEKEVGKLINEYQAFERKIKTIEKSQETYDVLLGQIAERQNQQKQQFVNAKKQIQSDEAQEKQEIQEKINAAIEKVNGLAEREADKIERDYSEYVEGLRGKLNELKAKKEIVSDTAEKIKEIEKAITNLEQNRINVEAQLKNIEDEEYDKTQLMTFQKRQKELKKSIQEMHEQSVVLRHEETISEFWKKAWSPTGIPSMLIDESIPFMNEKVSEYLEKLTNGRYLVSFDTLAATKKGEFRDKISVNVLDTHTRANSRIQLSGGQTRIVDIATILTLGDLQSNIQDVSINILLFDEIFDSLDEENIGFVSNILSQLKVGKSIYLISHTQVDQLEADEVLEFK